MRWCDVRGCATIDGQVRCDEDECETAPDDVWVVGATARWVQDGGCGSGVCGWVQWVYDGQVMG